MVYELAFKAVEDIEKVRVHQKASLNYTDSY